MFFSHPFYIATNMTCGRDKVHDVSFRKRRYPTRSDFAIGGEKPRKYCLFGNTFTTLIGNASFSLVFLNRLCG